MKKAWLILCVSVLIISGCKFHHYNRKLENTGQHVIENVRRFYLEDLNGDSQDEIILIQEPQTGISEITVRDKGFQVFSQLNYNAEVNYISFNDLDGDGEQEIFLSGKNASDEIFITQVNYEWKKELNRNTKELFSVDSRNELPAGVRDFCCFVVKGKDDIDNDGVNELFLAGLSGFSCYPRGIWVIDSKTGEEKWHYELASNFRSFLYKDLDGDGEEEIIISTQAFKNHSNIVNQMDDRHSYLLIFSKKGELLLKEEMVRGYSRLDSFAEDIDGDGAIELIMVKTTWGNQHERNGVSLYRWIKGRLILVREHQLEEAFARKSTVICQDIDNDGRQELFILTAEHELLLFNNMLEIIARNRSADLARICRVADLDNDGSYEAVCVSLDGSLVILDKALNCKLIDSNEDRSPSKIEIYDPGFGKKKQIMVNDSAKFSSYECIHLGFWQMVYWKLILIAFLVVSGIVFVMKFIFFKNSKTVGKSMLDSFSAGVLVLNRKERVVFANKKMEELCGKVNLEKKLLGNMGKLAGQLNVEYQKYKESGLSIYQNEYTLRDEGQHLEIQISDLEEPEGYILIKVSDKTDMVELQIKADWAETARGLSHGIRKHLNNILLATEQIAVINDPKVKNLTPIVLEEISNLKYFVQSFQRFTELKTLQLQLLDTNKLISEYLEAKLTELPDRIRFTSEIEHDLPWIEVDNIRFSEVVDNLINNAIEAIADKGKIIFKAYRWEEGINDVNFCLEISDTGCGMAEDIKKNIFVPYFTTKTSGTGIGLPLVMKMMNEFGGKVEFESKQNVGTTIRLVFPAVTRGRI